jgi:hypothetical protein
MGKIFPKEMARVEKGLCPLCGKEIDKNEFKDELSIKEFGISGMCQKCQNKIFK